MAKDPAFLFYPGDYLRDTQCLSERVQVAYDRIMCEHMRNICITKDQLKFFTKRLNDDERSEILMVLTEINGGYQIAWVAESIEKRREYSDSRRKNRTSKYVKKERTYDKHMENENEIVNEVKDVVTIETRRKNFYEEVGSKYSDKYPKEMLLKFCDYWSEHNEGGNKMKFEMQKVFNISMRLVTWNNNNKQFKKNGSTGITKDGLIEAIKKRTQSINVDGSTGG